MSKISLEPNASGAGTFSIVSPDSNTNRTLTLGDESGTIRTIEGIESRQNNFAQMPEIQGDQIFDQGSNGNGDFVRFSSGFMICTGPLLTGNQSRSFSSGITTSTGVGWTFPATFSSRPFVKGTVYRGDGGGTSFEYHVTERGTRTLTTSSAEFVVANINGVDDFSLDFYPVAIGLWK